MTRSLTDGADHPMNPSDPDDGWAELARELNLPEPEPARPKPDITPGVIPPSEAAAASGTPDPELAEPTDEVPEMAAAADDESDFGQGVDDGEDDGAESEAEGAAAEGGEAGEKKRRRRRRRRRKKGPGEAGAEGGERPAAVATDEGEGDEDEAPAEEEEEDAAPVGVAAEETSPEMAREIIANWNVPSWDEIVAGLYRPDR